MSNNNRAAALKKLDEISFAMVEMRLYMDTHPDDMGAAALQSRFENEYKAAKRNFIEECGPLTIYDGNAAKWCRNPWPWDNEGCGC